MKKNITIGTVIAALVTASCELGVQLQNSPTSNSSVHSAVIKSNDSIPIYYDAAIHILRFEELPPSNEVALIAHDDGFNFIYQSNQRLPNNQPFISVIDALPSSGANPIWREVQIDFNPGFTPRQMFGHDEIIAAASGAAPEITLTMKNEVYQSADVGR